MRPDSDGCTAGTDGPVPAGSGTEATGHVLGESGSWAVRQGEGPAVMRRRVSG